MSKTVSDLCREALELREKSPFVPKENWSFDDDSRTVDCSECGTEVDVSGFIVKSSDEHQAVDIHLYGMEKICKPQAEFIVFAANNIKAISERCLELEKDLELVRDSHKRQGELNTKAWAENQKLREALQYIFQEIENVDPDNRSKRDQDFHAHIMGFWIEDEALRGGQRG